MNYIGSKLSLLPFLEQVWQEIKTGDETTFLDPFAGTGAVGRRFRELGLTVTSGDLQEYAVALNRAYIGLPAEPADARPRLAELNALAPQPGGFLHQQYSPAGGRMYFTEETAARADAIRQQLDAWRTADEISEGTFDYLLASLLENLDAVANTASVYGAFLKKFKASALKPLVLKPLALPHGGPAGRAVLGDANALVAVTPTDVLYLDPPYNHRQYGANYHVLETVARYDAPTVGGTTGLRAGYERSAYCSRTQVRKAFAELIGAAQARHILVSYNDEGLLPLAELRALLGARGEVRTFETHYNRYKADNGRAYTRDATVEYVHYVKVTR
jgi:adenine-specific DNA-methyltransferase